VTGHGLDSALLSVTVLNVLRSYSLPNTDFRVPGQVLGALNDAFPMEKVGDKMFTIWYGVYNPGAATLSWSGGGHPDALLFEGPARPPVALHSEGPMIGMMPWPEFETSIRTIRSPSRLYVYSDGAHEVHKTDGSMWKFDEFVAHLSEPALGDDSRLDRLLRHVRELHGSDQLEDDFSIVEATL
jgi:sigma-B regulation protein RsbU (phosphoserine phosphatase)